MTGSQRPMTSHQPPAPNPQPQVAVFMGVSGAGKSTLGAAVAAALGWPFYDGDDLHPAANVAKMSAGIPLTDADRRPWLARLHDLIADHLARGEPAVVACSTLKRGYRKQLRAGNEGLIFVYLRGDRERIGRRLARRQGHYMPAGLLASQFADLEEPGPEEALVVDIDATAAEVAALLLGDWLGEQRSGGAVGQGGRGVDRLTEVSEIDEAIEPYLMRWGRIFKAFRQQDSGCISYGVELGGRRWFVKHSDQARGMASLGRARHLHRAIAHPALAHLYNSFTTPGGLAMVYEWLLGQVLSDYKASGVSREEPASAHARFRALPAERILAALDTIYDAHLTLAESGFVAVDFYDGCILYDFERHRTYLCDLDEYRSGPFVLEDERLPGSRRFMAPEEWQRGAVIDQVTNVYSLGRAAVILLGNGQLNGPEWRGGAALAAVITRATAADRALRQQSVQEFVAEWLAAREHADR